jgi:hypothetical protein
MVKVIEKGYTLEVTSWENDGDNYNTESLTVDTIEEAKRLHTICTTLFKSCNNGEGGIGNSMDGEENDTILEYVENNKDLFPEFEGEDDDFIIDHILHLACKLMGGSEYYDCRVCESVLVTYSPEDIYVEEIKF